MARSRSFPTHLFEEPDFFEQNSDTQAILLGLVLGADDYGRGQAHRGLLARKLNKEVHLIEQALSALEQSGFLTCYQAQRHWYYCLTHWQEWEILSRPTPSKYPAPPVSVAATSSQTRSETLNNSQASPESFRNPQENSGNVGATPSEGEEEKELEEKRIEGEAEEPPTNVVIFPTTRADDSDAILLFQQHVREATKQVAHILDLPVTDALSRIVEEHLRDPTLSVLGEADAAREWMDDPRRNRKGQRMSPAFFRRWLKREQETTLGHQTQQQATGTTGITSSTRSLTATDAPKITIAPSPPAANPYEAFLQRRLQEVQAARVKAPEMGGISS